MFRNNMVSFEFDNNSSKSLYVQLYEHLRDEISEGRIKTGERLPSLRSLADSLGISVTTVKVAYEQLMAEGYLISRPQSGFYAASGAGESSRRCSEAEAGSAPAESAEADAAATRRPADCDPETFDFVKWKKCMTSVLNEMPEQLLTEGDRQGEPELRAEIAKYLYQARGVVCTQRQVVISAGTQQLVSHIARILRMMGISHVSVEDPGYMPARSIFKDWGFSMSCIPVREDGVEIEKLPANIRTAVYVCPQNQFPTGAVMPIGRRRRLLEWAEENDSIVIEDDYNSELRYNCRPIPALQGLDQGRRVVYIGSFTSTLFPAVRISYMVLPRSMVELYDRIRMNYDQTCSKTEQLTLAQFMKKGFYSTNLKRVKKLYSKKLHEALSAVREYGSKDGFVTAENTQSGINITLRLDTHFRVISEGPSGQSRNEEIHRELTSRLMETAAGLGIKVRDIDQLDREGMIYLIFYYYQIPLDRIQSVVRDMISGFRNAVSLGSLTMPSVYEVVRITDGEPVFLPEHYQRLEKSLASMGKLPLFTYEELRGCIDDLVEESGIRNHNIKIEADVSGYSRLYLTPTHYPAPEMYKDGVKTDLFRGERRNPNVKMMDRALREATNAAIRDNDLYEVLLVDRNGFVTEGSRSNVFFIKDGEVYTAPSDKVLLGVTRSKVIEIINELGIRLHDEAPAAGDIAKYQAAFISGTSPKVLPIASIGEVSFDVNDPALRKIMEKYN